MRLTRARLHLAAATAALAACASSTPTAKLPAPSSRPPAPELFADLLMSADACTAPPRAVSRAEALADVATIERILQRGYAGYEVLARTGQSWERIFRSARASVERLAEPIAPSALREALAVPLCAVGDNHVALWEFSKEGWTHWRSTGRHDDAYTAELLLDRAGDSWVIRSGSGAGARLESCTGQELGEIVRPSVSPEPGLIYRLIVLAEKKPGPLECRLRAENGQVRALTLPLRRLVVGPKESGRPLVFERHPGRVSRLRLRTLSPAHTGSLDAFAASSADLRSAPAVILDLRGNSGGDDTWVMRWFVGLTSGELRYATIDELASEVTRQGDVNSAVCDLARGDNDQEGKATAEERLETARAALANATRTPGRPYREWHTRTPVANGRAPTAFSGRLVLLADSRCASSCETFFQYARQVPGSVIVGENTAGVGAFGDVRTYRLPHSGLGFSAGKKWFHDKDPRVLAPESRGYLPDLWLDSDQSPALAELLAECLTDPSCAVRFKPVLDRWHRSPGTGVLP